MSLMGRRCSRGLGTGTNLGVKAEGMGEGCRPVWRLWRLWCWPSQLSQQAGVGAARGRAAVREEGRAGLEVGQAGGWVRGAGRAGPGRREVGAGARAGRGVGAAGRVG